MQTIKVDGVSLGVSDQWFSVVIGGLGGRTEWASGVVQNTIQKMMVVSNQRRLAPSERDMLDNLTHLRNVVNAARMVGIHHDPKEWGLDGWDAVHGNSHLRPCGCEEHLVFDHHHVTDHFGHNRVQEGPPILHPIEPINVCDQHQKFAKDPHALREALNTLYDGN